jgi:hypothetical protein
MTGWLFEPPGQDVRFWTLLSGNSYRTFAYALPTNPPMLTIRTPAAARFQALSEDDLMQDLAKQKRP